jgi:hypothetical protein
MIQIMFLSVFLITTFFCEGQKILSCNNVAWAYIKSDGTVEDSHHRIKGQFKSDGSIVNSSGEILGFLKSNGSIENKNHELIGNIRSDGTVTNSAGKIKGYVRSDGTIYSAKHQKLASAQNIPGEWLACYFFFFKF